MTKGDVERIARAIAETPGFDGFALVIAVGEQTIVLLNNCCAAAAAELLSEAATSIDDGGQRPALFN